MTSTSTQLELRNAPKIYRPKVDLATAHTTYELAVAWQMDGDLKKALQECEEGLAIVERIPSATDERQKSQSLREELRKSLGNAG